MHSSIVTKLQQPYRWTCKYVNPFIHDAKMLLAKYSSKVVCILIGQTRSAPSARHTQTTSSSFLAYHRLINPFSNFLTTSPYSLLPCPPWWFRLSSEGGMYAGLGWA